MFTFTSFSHLHFYVFFAVTVPIDVQLAAMMKESCDIMRDEYGVVCQSTPFLYAKAAEVFGSFSLLAGLATARLLLRASAMDDAEVTINEKKRVIR